MGFWIQQGVIKESKPDTYEIVELNESSTSGGPTSSSVASRIAGGCEEEEEDGVNSDTEKDKREKDEQLFWNYVQGMLKNFESLPLERIHKMLQMFAMHDADMQIESGQLRHLLNAKVQSGLLTIEQGKYKLVKENT
uniref:Anaphase-promoting complex subunit 2-like n=1 Tax=Phallusia mammillata TaxID=59560 RepID=A0A6F9D5S6_9ASCI|nr:anaphase-promoting complex subunit 2-like [Phallusia mammillata]